MPENKRDTSALPMYSMPGAFDGEPEPEDYEDAPEITEAMFEQATWYDGEGRVIRKNGRPVSANPREQVTIRIPRDLLAKWRATGPGWQTRMVERLHLD